MHAPRLAAAALLAVLALPAQAGWVRYGESDTGTYYYDPQTVRSEGSNRQVWRLFDLKEQRPDGVRSGKALVELECKALTYRYLRTWYFSGALGQGRTVGSARVQPVEPIGPGSTIAALAARVCPQRP